MNKSESEYLRVLLGAGELDVKDQYVCLFIPSQTRTGDPIAHERWRDEAVDIMSRLFGGATVVESIGGWFDPLESRVKKERVSLVFSMIAEHEWNEVNVSELSAFLHKLGRITEQGEVALLVMNQLLRIREFRYEQ